MTRPAGPMANSNGAKRRGHARVSGRANPLRLLVRCVEWFESRGVYVPGEDASTLSPWRDFGWIIVAWLLAVAAFVVLFAVAS